MTITEILSFVGQIVMVLGVFFLALFGYLLLAARRVARQEDRVNSLVQALDQGQLIALRVETSNDQFLCYNAQTNDFVCQGRSLTEITQHFKLRFPDKDAAICQGDETAVRVLKQQIKELYESSNSVGSPS